NPESPAVDRPPLANGGGSGRAGATKGKPGAERATGALGGYEGGERETKTPKGGNKNAKTTTCLFAVAAACLCIPGHRVRAQEPPAKEPDKKEVPALAKEIVKMKVVRVLNEKLEVDRAEKTIADKEKIGQLLVLFPEVGTDKKPDVPPDG